MTQDELTIQADRLMAAGDQEGLRTFLRAHGVLDAKGEPERFCDDIDPENCVWRWRQKPVPTRFIVIDTSVSYHCCFEATVQDTATIDQAGDPQTVCECFDLKSAKLVARALNELHAAGKAG